MKVKNTRELITPDNFFLRLLIYALPGTGKSSWLGTVPDVGVGACETGHGSGLLSVACSDLDYVEPENFSDMQAFATGKDGLFKDKTALAFDSLSEGYRRHIKPEALKLPRSNGNTQKRDQGIPELDDYGVMGEITRKFLLKLINSNPRKHIIVTATERYNNPEGGAGEFLVGPDLPGAMFLASTAVFDFVFRMRTRPVLRNPNDAKTRYTQRYFVTQPDGRGTIAKCRSNIKGTPLLEPEIIFDLEKGTGTFSDILNRILSGYAGEAHARAKDTNTRGTSMG